MTGPKTECSTAEVIWSPSDMLSALTITTTYHLTTGHSTYKPLDQPLLQSKDMFKTLQLHVIRKKKGKLPGGRKRSSQRGEGDNRQGRREGINEQKE